MLKFIKQTIFYSTPLIVLLILVNYFGDAAKLFHKGYEKKIAAILLGGKNVANLMNYNERVLQKEMILNHNFKADTIVLGSSRTMLLSSKLLRKKIFNNSVSGATLQDIIAIYHLYKKNNKIPKNIIIGIDPWLFNKYSGLKGWSVLSKEYHAFIKYKGPLIQDDTHTPYLELLSISYFQESLKVLIRSFQNNTDLQATNKTQSELQTRLIDGSLVYDRKTRERSVVEVNKLAEYFMKGDLYGLHDFSKLSNELVSEFKLLIDEMQKSKVNIVFLLLPYHPYVYHKIEKEYLPVIETEQFIYDFSNKYAIPIFGSFNPDQVNAKEDMFYDGMHSNVLGLKMLLTSFSLYSQI